MPARLEHRQAAPDFVANQGSETLGGFIEDQEPWIGHQRAADRQHLLLAAGERVTHVASPLGKAWEQRVNLFDRPRIGAAAAIARCGNQVFAHRQIRKYLAPFRHEANSELRNPKRGELADVLPGETDRAGARGRQPQDGADGRGFAHAVAAHHGHHLARSNRE